MSINNCKESQLLRCLIPKTLYLYYYYDQLLIFQYYKRILLQSNINKNKL